MSACFEQQNGVWGVSQTSPSQCTGYVLLEPADYEQLASGSAAQLDVSEVGLSWGLACALVLSFWAMGLKLRIANKGISQIR
jgi:hypothetical protein